MSRITKRPQSRNNSRSPSTRWPPSRKRKGTYFHVLRSCRVHFATAVAAHAAIQSSSLRRADGHLLVPIVGRSTCPVSCRCGCRATPFGSLARSAMQMSLPGLLVVVAILVVAYYSRGMLIIGLVASQAFGATAVVTLTFLGGSSPLIYTIFAALLVMAVAARRRIWFDFGSVFGSIRPVWVAFLEETDEKGRMPAAGKVALVHRRQRGWGASLPRRMLSGTERRWLHHPRQQRDLLGWGSHG